MKIFFGGLKEEYRSIQNEIDEAIRRVLKSGRFILGPEVESFEKKLAQYIGVKYCVAVNSGTDALSLSLLCAGIGKGDEVIVPIHTAIPTAMAVLINGATPVFVDCDEAYLIDINKIAQVITPATKAIIPVHLYGQPCNMEKLSMFAKKHGLVLIEDCAQANGASWAGKKVGSWGDFGCFSFYPTKNLGAYGDGGAIVTNEESIYKKLLALRFYGQSDRDSANFFGVNSRLDEIQASILSVKLKHLDEWNKKRCKIASWYQSLIKNSAILLPINKNGHVYHLFVIRSNQRDKLQLFLKERGIETLVHYRKPLHHQPVFKKFAESYYPNAEKIVDEILSLPMHPFLEEEEVKEIAGVINEFMV